ncbi:182 kDa tankyrase-1-binding protein [Xyrauchen texanus]|uniref:182 kDa tankyrase-1-binding protein n=1 Tax=Xyrauchen texanus TaxID=154827 RepID=UPI00224233FD|nr:182 kDa tankyrase-1-binding protein [Xyrauchen texanus]
MAAQLEATTREMSQSEVLISPDKSSVLALAPSGDTGMTALGPKPYLIPKPFSLQRNTTIRPIKAPKTEIERFPRATSSDNLDLLSFTKPADTRVGDLKTPGSLKLDSNGTSNGCNKSTGPKPVPLCTKPDLLANTKPEPNRNADKTDSDHQTGTNIKPEWTNVTATSAEDLKEVPPRSRTKSLGVQDKQKLKQSPEGETATSKTDAEGNLPIWPRRNRLSMELTSRFESHLQLEKEVNSVRRDSEKERPPNSPSEESNLKSSEPLVETGEMGGEEVSVRSIKRRIGLLFDRSTASQHRDSFNKRDATLSEISVDIKQRIKNLSLNSHELRIRLPSTGALKCPIEKTPSNSDELPFDEKALEKPADSKNRSQRPLGKQAADKPSSSTEVQPFAGAERMSGELDKVIENKPDINVKAKEAPTSNFGFEKNVLIEDKNSIDEENDEVVEYKENYIPVPLYQRVGIGKDAVTKREEEEIQQKEEQLEKQLERERLLEEERMAKKEIERQQEEEWKHAGEEKRLEDERRKQERTQKEERQRQMEERRKQEEDERKQVEKEREKQRMLERLEKERQLEEEMSRIEEERKKERQREEERLRLEKERELKEEKRRNEEEILRQEKEKEREMEERRQIEEEERLRQEREKERLKKEKEMEEERRRIKEMERLKEEEQLRQQREKERIRKEKEMEEGRRQIEEIERQKEEERLRQEKERLQKEREMEEGRRRIEEMERQKEEERLRQEKERLQKEREMEEERRRLEEMERLKEERLRQEKERLQKEKEMEEGRRRIEAMERQKEEERLRQEKERLEMERQKEEERLRQEKERLEMERQKEEERLRQERERLQKEREMEEERRRLEEMERLKEERLRQEKERLQKEKEMEEGRRRIEAMERQKEEERLRQEKERLEMERQKEEERLRQEKERLEMERQKEEERLRQERERLQKEKEMEEGRRRIEAMERQKEEERLRQEKERLEMERQKEEERLRQERERLEMERQKEEERLRQERERLEMERQKEEERLRQERERLEMERQKEEERLRQAREMERIRKEKEKEEDRRQIEKIERQKEEERLRQKIEKDRLRKEREMEEERRLIEEERQREAERLKEEKENERLKKEREMEKCIEVEKLREEFPTSYNLISFDSEEPVLSQSLVSSDNVSPQLAEVLYDDFSVKPRRWGTQARHSSTPSPSREPPAVDVIPEQLDPKPESRSNGYQALLGNQVYVDDLIGFEPAPSNMQKPSRNQLQAVDSEPEFWSNPKTESPAIWLDGITSHEGQLQESALEEDEVTEQDLIKEFDNLDEINNTVDDLVAESRNVQALQRVKRKSKTDSDPTNAPGQEEPESLHFPESSAPLLDSSVFRSKVDLGKKRSIKRSRPSRAIRQRAALPTLTEGTHPDWRFCDSTDVTAQCSNGGDSESEEEPSKDSTSSPAPSQPKRVPLFPGMDQSALMAQLKRRSGAVETDTPSEGLTTPPVPTHSPCTPTMSLSPRVLPSLDSKDSGSGPSPSWLLELKSKKRASQPESEA